MAFYSGCSLIVTIPQGYSKKDDLTQYLSSKLDGCEISVVEHSTAKKPFAERVMIREDANLQETRDFASLGNPAPKEITSGEFLMVTAGEAIHEFLRDFKK